eukprot:CAMPEP_0178647690 /NCGR_PEP_ID=MMETSP0698-20121128/20061_1 /TAXON_ID=265572 /ORGANISM="Extubocellulus spinifer, Strain CCMP396" /LENGTH=654 /DNA_ID=CAMNT_0020288967 /DNA_START=133 /DNA_END=2098 /DNA_ORIENTATION=-
MVPAVSSDGDVDKREKRKTELKAEAKRLGVTYKELKEKKKREKANKKDKEKKKRKREAERLKADAEENVEGGDVHRSEMKRMRAYSKDLDEPRADGPEEKRRRTRSMDLADHGVANNAREGGGESKLETVDEEIKKTKSPKEWRVEHSITIRGHGKHSTQKTFADPYFQFADAPFSESIQRSLKAAGFSAPTAIQSQAWPIAVKGEDMICIAKTGSGKTCGFLLPSLHQFLLAGGRSKNQRPGNMAENGPVLLVLAPTRELACQIMEESQRFGRSCGARTICCYGGSNKFPQIAAFERGIEVVIATPGRLNDLLEMRKADLSRVKFLVLDEADRMLDMGFEPQIRSIVAKVPEQRQTLLFSATWPKEIQRLAHDFLKDPIQINVGEVDALVANKDIKQHIHMLREDDKADKLKEILRELIDQGGVVEDTKSTPGGGRAPVDLGGKKHAKVIVFVAKKVNCHELANQLWDEGFAVDSLHGDRAQWERTKVIGAFKAGTLRMLIATDVAARGLDVKDVGVVVNYDMPAGVNAVEDYVHRIGRTGRAGAKGISHTFFTNKDSKAATQLVEVLAKAEQEVPAELQALVDPDMAVAEAGAGVVVAAVVEEVIVTVAEEVVEVTCLAAVDVAGEVEDLGEAAVVGKMIFCFNIILHSREL